MRVFTSILLLMIGLSISTLYAQKPKITWGPEEKLGKLSLSTQIVGMSNAGHYEVEYSAPLFLSLGGIPIKISQERYEIKRFNKEMKLMEEKKFDLTFNGKKRTFHSCVYMKGNLYVFSRFYDKAKAQNSLYVDRIDLETLSNKGKPTLIAEIPAEKKKNAGYFNTNVSKDSSKLFVFYDFPTPRKKKLELKEKVGIKVFNKDLDVLWEKSDITFDFSSKQFSQQGGMVDNEGNVVIFGKAYEGDGRKKRESTKGGKPNYSFVFRSFREKGTEVKDYNFELGERFITDIRLEFDQNNHLACAGFYSDDKRTWTASGIFYFHLNPADMGKYAETEAAFSKKTLALLSKRETTKQGELYSFDINKLILRRDGGAVILAEQSFVRWVTSTNSSTNSSRSYPVYYNMNILVTSINSIGEVEWVQVIPKKQIMANSNMANSYNYIILPEKVAIIFNDNEKNINAVAGSNVSNFKGSKSKGIASIVYIDQQGKVERKVLYSFAEHKKYLMPASTEQYNNRQAIIMIRRGAKARRARLTFP